VERIRLIPAWLYQRYRPFCDRLIPALGMAFLFVLTAQATAAFPQEWRLFIAGGVLLAGLLAPVAGYVLFTLALAYPLYSISIYIAALALAVLIPLAFFLTRHLTALLLVLASPLLASYRIAPLVPLLAGLWWAEWGGVLAGLGSALWLKIFAGMCGATLDLTQLGGRRLAVHQLVARFHTANSLQTLLWIAEPFAPDSQTLLLHVLEILGWGLAGYGVGLMRQRMEGMPRPNVGLLASISAGLLGIGIGSLAVPVALGLREALALPVPFLDFLVECCWSSVVAIGLYGVSRYLTRPAVVPLRSPIKPYRPTVRPAPKPASQPWVRPQPRDDDQTDIIMIDLD
jgi:hypothetical protein